MYFFEHQITLTKYNSTVNQFSFSIEESSYLIDLGRSIVHHQVLDFILIELSEENLKKEFVLLLKTKPPHSDLFTYLSEKIESFEEKMITRVKEYEEELVTKLVN